MRAAQLLLLVLLAAAAAVAVATPQHDVFAGEEPEEGADTPAHRLAAQAQAATNARTEREAPYVIKKVPVHKMFRDLDTDKDGKVTHVEIMARLNRVDKIDSGSEEDGPDPGLAGLEGVQLSEEDKEMMIKEFKDLDKDGTETINWAEMSNYLLNTEEEAPETGTGEDGTLDETMVMEEHPEEKREREHAERQEAVIKTIEKRRFDAVDEDSSGELSFEEYHAFNTKEFRKLDQEMHDLMQTDYVKTQVAGADGDESGALSQKEFAAHHDKMMELGTHPEHLKHLWEHKSEL